jgi:hypothetical protein
MENRMYSTLFVASLLLIGIDSFAPSTNYNNKCLRTANHGNSRKFHPIHVSRSEFPGQLEDASLEDTKPPSTINGGINTITSTDYSDMTTLPRHPTNEVANEILIQTESALRKMQEKELFLAKGEEDNAIWSASRGGSDTILQMDQDEEIPNEEGQESVYANSYVDLGKVDTVGFDFDYTLVTYTQQLLELIYDMALRRLVNEKEYPSAMLSSGLKVRLDECAAV